MYWISMNNNEIKFSKYQMNITNIIMGLTRNDSQLSKFHHNYLTFTSWKKKNIFSIPIQLPTLFFYQLHYPQMLVTDQPTAVDLCYTSSRESSRRERRDSPFRKSSICRPNNLCLMKWTPWRSSFPNYAVGVPMPDAAYLRTKRHRQYDAKQS